MPGVHAFQRCNAYMREFNSCIAMHLGIGYFQVDIFGTFYEVLSKTLAWTLKVVSPARQGQREIIEDV